MFVPVRRLAFVVAFTVLVAACTDGGLDPGSLDFPEQTQQVSTTSPSIVITTPTTLPPQVIPHGGVVRVGVWGETDPTAKTLTGAMIRSLTQPQLFAAGTDGSWVPSLVEPGTDLDGADFRSASFRIRAGASWSDGTPITDRDLSDSADGRFVHNVSLDGDGIFTVLFNQPFPNWRRLWSGLDVVSPPGDDLFGGPWRVQSVDPDLEVVLVPNDSWWGEGPFLDELRLVVVPDQGVMLDIFASGGLDVVAPNVSSGRLPTMEALAPGRVATSFGGGWWVGLVVNPSRVELADRLVLLAAVDPAFFVGALLKGEAVTGFLGSAPVPYPAPELSDIQNLITITAPDDVATIGSVERAVLLAIRNVGGVVPELREGTSDLVDGWIADGDFDASIGLHYDGPGGPCWMCRFGDFDEASGRLQDGGGDGFDTILATEGIARVLWRPIQVVAWGERINGVVSNGWALSSAWNSHEWWVG